MEPSQSFPQHQGGFRSSWATHVPIKGDDPHQNRFPCSSTTTSRLPLRGPSWDVGWGLTHLFYSCHCPQGAQPAPAGPCLAPEGHKGAVGANLSLHSCTASQEEQHRGGLAEPEEQGREGPSPTCCPPFPLTSLTCSTLCSLLAKIPPGCPWGLLILPGDRKGGGSRAPGSPPQPDTTSPPPQTATGTSAACRLPRDMSWQVPPKISLWG